MKINEKKYKLLIFDWDGTLMDSAVHAISCMHYLAEKFNLPKHNETEIRQRLYLTFFDAIKSLYDYHDYEKLYESYKSYYLSTIDVERFFDGALELLKTCSEKEIPLAIATNKIRPNLNTALDRANIKHMFAATRCGDDEFRKPQQEVINSILDEICVKKNDALMIGDTECDILSAKASGVDVVIVDNGRNAIPTMQHHSSVIFLDGIKDLLKYLD